MTPDELRELFLFADLDDEQLAWVADNGHVERFAANTMVTAQGDPATGFYVLLSGTLSMSRMVRGQSVEITRTDYRGAYSGSVQFYLGDDEPTYRGSVRAVTECTFLVLPAGEFGEQFRTWFPMAAHLLEGIIVGGRNRESVIAPRERLLALGRLTAGLTHELNNPAAAASRATAALGERVGGMRHKLAILAGSDLDAVQLKQLTVMQEEIVARMSTVEPMSPLETSDREDEINDWLDDHDITTGWEPTGDLRRRRRHRRRSESPRVRSRH